MMNIPDKTLEDLEFKKVLAEVKKYAKTERVAAVIEKLKPLENHQAALFRLKATNEFLTGIQSSTPFPFSDYDDIREELNNLDIENYQMPLAAFLAIRSQILQIKDLVKFLTRFEAYFPVFFHHIQKLNLENEILNHINQVFEKSGEIKNNATPRLAQIREGLKRTQRALSERFTGAMRHYNEFLDDIRESVIDGRRVLAVASMHRKKVPGRMVGTSKTGSISFIEPEAVLQSQRELDELTEDEKNEIKVILRELTALLAEYQEDLIAYQNFLFQMDLIASQAKYADEIQAILPKIHLKDKKMFLREAYHPVLWLKYQKEKKKIVPQSLGFDENNRLLLISGPNAGGKSITLKTIGLLQLMLQSGMLIPVHEKSEMCFFEKIFTDIGDNQSIDNQLSTYSYRLKQMHDFLYNTNDKTLLLIDEFGTGSDPELGGALAEVFLEEFYSMGAFGVFTTHYTNIKVLVEQWDAAKNASMLFDEKTLEPLFQLEVGQAGSSFTFEVAQKNKIPFRLINRAKKKIERNKVRLDKTILKLQQEKFNIQKTRNELEELRNASDEQKNQLEETQDRIQSKLVDFQRLYEKEQKNIQLGKRIEELADNYLKNKSRKKLIGDFLKLIETENAKKPKNHFQEKKVERRKQKALKREMQKQAENIEEIKKKVEAVEKKQTQAKIDKIKIGKRVRIKGSSSVGTVERVEGNSIIINYGKFLTKINVHEVESI
uniref:endonuclease MutS2 n=2 Tax=Candidatus Ornithobacterium hominis TaxID=2497989 RepID=UPI0021AA768F|nr:AAA family ATPase [Candidatus Ornithobacterium hominis]